MKGKQVCYLNKILVYYSKDIGPVIVTDIVIYSQVLIYVTKCGPVITLVLGQSLRYKINFGMSQDIMYYVLVDWCRCEIVSDEL